MCQLSSIAGTVDVAAERAPLRLCWRCNARRRCFLLWCSRDWWLPQLPAALCLVSQHLIAKLCSNV